MALVKCPECGWKISDKADSCPGCGYPINKDINMNKNQLNKCPYCGDPVNGTDEYCESCGMRLSSYKDEHQNKSNQFFSDSNKSNHYSNTKQKKGRYLKPIIFTIILFVFFGVMSNIINDDKEIAADGNGITIETETTMAKIDTQSKNSADEPAPESVFAIDIFYLDLYNNYEDYIDKYVTISGPIDYVSNDSSFSIKKGIDGFTGMISIDLSSPYKTEKGKYVSVTGRVDSKVLGYLYLKEAIVESYGKSSKKIYKKQKEDYDEVKANEAQSEQEKRKIEVDQFISECKTYNYDELRRNPDDYLGAKIKLNVKINQEMDGGIFNGEPYYRCNENDDLDMWLGNEYLVEHSEAYKESNIITDDIVTIYGEFNGVTEVTRALTKTKESIPSVKAVSIELNN
ncbi:zinc-ribbon domain-containing protein [Robinsoniella sp.]|uniref:zinc ribbon domain-containing protein n=1 Tax=Robinsoniella sp. TaxID=2496533 RepID=UPI0037508A4B